MKRTIRNAIALALCAVLCIGLMAGCGSSPAPSTTAPAATPTTAPAAAAPAATEKPQEITKLVWYMSINPVAADTQMVIDKLNEYTRDKIGVEIDYQIMANPDYKEKMPNLVNSGGYFDICFTANWTLNYLQNVGRDAFLDITDLLPQYAPETFDFIPEAIWNAVSVNGSIYGVPSYKEMGWQGGILYNSDMADAYGIDMSKVKSIEDYTDVLKTVKEKSLAEKKDVIGVSGLGSAWQIAAPYETMTGTPTLPGACAVPEMKNFADMAGTTVFNQYASEE